MKLLNILILLVILYILRLYLYQNSFRNKFQTKVIYCFWTGDNLMSEARKNAFEQLCLISGCQVQLITKKDINPIDLHPAFEYLSETHKADYLRTHYMHFYGGGYSDIKIPTASWSNCFDEMKKNDFWICGYPEVEGGVAYAPLANKWKELIGNGAYICKPQTPLTKAWYDSMISLLDNKLELLKKNPAKSPQDCAEQGHGYPIEWNEMLGRIFHKVCYDYKDHITNTLPPLVFTNYR